MTHRRSILLLPLMACLMLSAACVTTNPDTANLVAGGALQPTGTPGVTLGSLMGAATEMGGTVTFTVVLDRQPTGAVRMLVTSSDSTEVAVTTGAALDFDFNNWDTPQAVTLTGQDDNALDGTQTVTIQVAADSVNTGAVEYLAVQATQMVTNADDDTAGIMLGNLSGMTTEAGGSATFTVTLSAAPNADVTVTLASGDSGEVGVTTGGSLVFTSDNYATPQMVVLTGQDDMLFDGDVSVTITATAGDTGGYNGETGTLMVTNTDDDSRGFQFGTPSANTTESGGTATFTVALNVQPTADVAVTVTSGDTTEVQVTGGGMLTFTVANWDQPQTVTVTGQDDGDIDGSQMVAITATAGNTGGFAGETGVVTMTNIDNDSPGILLGMPNIGNTTESGGQAQFSVALTVQPSATVTVAVTSGNTSEIQITSGASLMFTTSNWNTPQLVTATGQDDSLADGDVTVTITATANQAGGYNGETAMLNLVNQNDEVAAVNVASPSGNTREDGTTATFEVRLLAPPSGDVTVTITTSQSSEIQVQGSGTLTFTTSNWNVDQTVTVVGQDDAILDGDQTVTMTATANGGGYNGEFGSIPVINEDDEVLVPIKDTTIFSGQTGRSNGAGASIYAGKGGGGAGLRRALMKFDVAALGCTTVTAVSLQLRVEQTTNSGDAQTLELHRLTADWGEDSSSGGSQGAAAQPGDATWVNRFHSSPSTIAWTSAGGDFDGTASHSMSVTPGTRTLMDNTTGDGLVADVQAWVDNAGNNHGWLLKTSAAVEGGGPNGAMKIASRQNSNSERRPKLTVTCN